MDTLSAKDLRERAEKAKAEQVKRERAEKAAKCVKQMGQVVKKLHEYAELGYFSCSLYFNDVDCISREQMADLAKHGFKVTDSRGEREHHQPYELVVTVSW